MVVAQLQKTLMAKQQELKRRLEDISNDVTTERDQRFNDHDDECRSRQSLQEIYQQTQLQLQKIEDTLALLQTEQHGICCQCGLAIDEQRLATMPSVKTCIQCAR
ncbi:TraR/DksA C4-type zinc finger protein [Thalassotalea maritima]|uniref:TraR/DksA C4-type zinc finger protein n=1 Tax=Thalassotalea maritima TaxID=3242416 RepID=UPI003527D251